MPDKPNTTPPADALEAGATPTSATEKINKPAAPRKRKPAKPKRKAPAKRRPASKAVAVVAPKDNGRPPYEPGNNGPKVKMLAGVGVNVPNIAQWLGISETTLRKYHAADLDAGAVEANAKVASALFTAATNKQKPNVTAMIFWLKARAGWKEDPARPLVPPPAPNAEPKPEVPGKKEAANVAALTAEIGTGWEELLGTPGQVGSMQ